MTDYRLEEDYMGGKCLRLKDFDEYGILLNGHVDGFVYEREGHTNIFSVSAVIRGKARVSDLTDQELTELLNHARREARAANVDFERAVQLRELEKRLLEEGKIARSAA